jgi:hypothetical protein
VAGDVTIEDMDMFDKYLVLVLQKGGIPVICSLPMPLQIDLKVCLQSATNIIVFVEHIIKELLQDLHNFFFLLLGGPKKFPNFVHIFHKERCLIFIQKACVRKSFDKLDGDFDSKILVEESKLLITIA